MKVCYIITLQETRKLIAKTLSCFPAFFSFVALAVNTNTLRSLEEGKKKNVS